MSSPINRFDDTHNNFKNINEQIGCLSQIAVDLENVGNTFLAERLYKSCDQLIKSLKRLRELNVEEIMDQTKIVQEHSNNILMATLAGIELANK